jgi:hypothetical protein
MNIPEKINVEVYLNGKCKNFKFIGSYNSEYFPMGGEYINLILPIFINKIESWSEIKDEVSPVDIINHLENMEWMDESNFLENYGVAFHTNYQKTKNEIEKLNSIIKDELDGPNENNILFVSTGKSINFDHDFDWSATKEWARRDADFIVLFEDELLESNTIYLSEEVYDEVIDLLRIIWKKLINQY